MHRLRHLVKCLLGTREWAWVYAWQTEEEAKELRGQSDSDWAQDKSTRRSVSSGFVSRGRHVLETWTQGQQLIALSSGEAEFYAAGSAAARLLYHVYLLRELGWKPRATLACDSSAARGVINRAGPGRIRHLQTRFLWVQERVKNGDFTVVAVPGASNAADLGTKILQGARVVALCAALGLRPRTMLSLIHI